MTEMKDRMTEPTDTDTPTPTPQPISPIRRMMFRVILLFGGLALAAGIAEALLWVVAPIPYSEWLVWEPEGHIRARPMPNQVVHTAEGYEVRINKYGFRGPDYAYRKQPGTLRIEVFGGSAGFCFRASGREATWPAVLERLLSERLNMPVQVINLALPGYDVFNSKLNYLCFGRAFEPDAVIVYHTWNDMKLFRYVPHIPYGPVTWVPNKPLWQRIARATQIGRRARQVIWTATKRKMENTYRKAEGTNEGIDAPVDEKAFAWERQNFLDFARMIQAAGQLPILVSQASLATLDNLDDPDVRMATAPVPGMVRMTVPLATASWNRVSHIIEEAARVTGAVFVDGYDAVPHDLEHMFDEVHLRDAGSVKLATAIADTLLSDRRFQEVVTRVRGETAAGADHRDNDTAP